jgi:hypothetical protein
VVGGRVYKRRGAKVLERKVLQADTRRLCGARSILKVELEAKQSPLVREQQIEIDTKGLSRRRWRMVWTQAAR